MILLMAVQSGFHSPVEGQVVFSHYLIGFQHHPRWLFGISAINSSIMVMRFPSWDFFHIRSLCRLTWMWSDLNLLWVSKDGIQSAFFDMGLNMLYITCYLSQKDQSTSSRIIVDHWDHPSQTSIVEDPFRICRKVSQPESQCLDPTSRWFRSFGFLWSSLPTSPQVSHEKNLGWLGYIGDEILPSCIIQLYYMGIIINHYKDPY